MFFGFDFVSWAFGVISESEKSWPNSKLQRLSPRSVSAFHLRLVRDGLEKTLLWVCGDRGPVTHAGACAPALLTPSHGLGVLAASLAVGARFPTRPAV